MLIVRYFKPILITVRENLEGILRTKGRDQGVIKYSLAIIAIISYISASFVRARSVRVSSVYASSVRTSSV